MTKPPSRINRLLVAVLTVNAVGLLVLLLLFAAPGGNTDGSGDGAPRVVEYSEEQRLDERFKRDVQPLLEQFCFRCHDSEQQKGAVTLDVIGSLQDVKQDRALWQEAAKQLHARYMPPSDPLPTPQQVTVITEWIEDALNHCDCSGEINPGRVTIRRLNRNEYNNTIRDLVGIAFRPADDFPADDTGYGFDTIGEVLSVSPLHAEKYLAAAEQVMDRAIRTRDPVQRSKKRFTGAQLQVDGGGQVREANTLFMYSQGEGFVQYDFPATADYEFTVRTWASQAGDELAKVALRVNSRDGEVFEVRGAQSKPETHTFRMRIERGKHRVAAAFVNDYYDPEHPDPARRDRNLAIMAITIDGPLNVKPPPPSAIHQAIIFTLPDDSTSEDTAARRIIARFATRAFRRPVTEEEVADFLSLFHLAREQGDNFEASVRLALTGVLVSPHFLYRVEVERPAPDGARTQSIGDWELASRLSYFLWSSMPDAELFEHAEQDTLSNPVVLSAQVKRMLADSKAHAFVEHFTGQWLELRSLDELTPDLNLYSEYDNVLRDSMRREAELFVAELIAEDRSLLELIDAPYTYVNGPLARHYGIDGVDGEQFQRVDVTGSPRGGVLTMGAVLTVTSNPTRTSPVKRGKWVLEQVLGTPPPSPPPDVPALIEDEKGQTPGPMRAQLEKHATDPTCAVCHVRLDPIGFAMENFNAIGKWREDDRGFEIDASGTLPGGHSFEGPQGLKDLIMSRRDEFVRCFSEKVLTYALGRGLEYYDRCAVDDICQAVRTDDHRFSSLIIAIVQSDPFLKRSLVPDDQWE